MRAGDRQAVRPPARGVTSAGRRRDRPTCRLWEKLRRSCATASRSDRRSPPCCCRHRPALACDAGSFDPADQPPFGGQTTTLSRSLAPGARVPGFRLTPGQATALATEALTPWIGASLRDPNPDRPRPAPAVAGRLLRRGGQGRRPGGDRRRGSMRAGDVDRHPGRHQARPRISGRRLRQGEQLVDLAAALRALPGAVRRSTAAASPDPSRPPGAARLQRLPRLLQPREDRRLGRPGLSGAGLRLPAHAGRRLQADPRAATDCCRWRRGAGWWRASSRSWPSTLPTSPPRGR